MSIILKTTNLCKSFNGQTAVNNISLNIERNSVYGLLGPNGAGKSTTLKMITGILRPTSGSIEFDGHAWKRSDLNHQYMTLYWWYAFLLPGAIAILCSLSHRKEENAGKYYSVFSMPVNLSRFEFAKGIILVEKLLVSAIFLALLISISNIIAPATAVYSLLHSITGSIGIILASVWQIPLCLYLARKTGMFVPIVLNTILGIVLSTATALGNTIAWWFVPYCWAAKLAEPLMGIEMNGTYAGNCGFSIAIMISISLSILLFLILSYADAKDFSKGR